MRRGERGSTTLEFGLVALPFLLLVFGGIEYARQLWTLQALQLTANQTARCVAIGGAACATSPATYAINTASGLGAWNLAASGVVIVNPDSADCTLPTGNTAAFVKLSLSFISPVGTFIPGLNRTLTSVSCYPLTGN